MLSSPWQKPFRGMQLNKVHPLARGLVGCWVMNEATGDKIFNLSRNGKHGINNGADWVPDGLNFIAGNSDYVDLDGPLGSTSSGVKTVVLRVKPSSATIGYVLANYDASSHGFSLIYNPDRTLGIAWTNIINTVQTTETIPIASPSNIAAVYNTGATGGQIFINGVLSKDGNLGTEQTTTNNIKLSSRWVTPNTGTAVPFDGIVSFTYLYNRAISADEITLLNREPYAMFQQPISPASLYYEAVAAEANPYWYYQMLRRRN